MLAVLLIGLAAGAFLCCWARSNSRTAQIGTDIAAMLAVAGFFIPASATIIETLADDTVFMTKVHEVLLNPVFLASGAYLGPYIAGRLLESARLPAQR